MSWQDEASAQQLNPDLLRRLGQLTAIQKEITGLGDFGLAQGRETHALHASTQKDLSPMR